jgi:hypothetical protein
MYFLSCIFLTRAAKCLLLATFILPKASVAACPQPEKVYVIGVEAIAYSPHYNFVEHDQPNFFAGFVDWLSKRTECQFLVKALPIKRLKSEYQQGKSIDFIYPDNPNWHSESDIGLRHYSDSIVLALGGTIVIKENSNIKVEQFKHLAFPRGFSPVGWYKLKENVTFTETFSALSALKMVVSNRVDGADIEYNVAEFLMEQGNIDNLVMAKNLPFTPTNFYLSTYKETKLLTLINQKMKQFPDEISRLKTQAGLTEKAP